MVILTICTYAIFVGLSVLIPYIGTVIVTIPVIIFGGFLGRLFHHSTGNFDQGGYSCLA
ncbi:conserved hypothetical protein [Xenorhabdus bovienii str. Jollieti]|uniref:Uncharacterized protein n=1 Tax=Xenorhabdus bovienii (strain SS-2004) TaxID=406818 RepID=D3V7D9_XENBS|nr:conserved hypothetical protein [Xenorhabdus bovienii SS-2004]CDH27630.1 conserved hypothetical protein [Xenorhabdus bovienii str. Jollieti]